MCTGATETEGSLEVIDPARLVNSTPVKDPASKTQGKWRLRQNICDCLLQGCIQRHTCIHVCCLLQLCTQRYMCIHVCCLLQGCTQRHVHTCLLSAAERHTEIHVHTLPQAHNARGGARAPESTTSYLRHRDTNGGP